MESPDPNGSKNLAALARGEVHVWTVNPERKTSREELATWEHWLTDDEQRRRERFHFERDRHRFFVTRALIRETLSRYAGIEPAAWRFEATEHGRPEIAGPESSPPLRFNVSHTTGLAVCAVALEREVGVDVEDARRPGETVRIANRYFSQREVADLGRQPLASQRQRFFDYWTLKESYIKACGLGLKIPLEQFSFELPDADPAGPGGAAIRISFDPRLDDDPAVWQFDLRRWSPDHPLALSIRRGRDANLAIHVRDGLAA